MAKAERAGSAPSFDAVPTRGKLPDDFTFFKADHWHGSFRDPSNRWQFIVQRILPQWRKLETDGTVETQMHMYAMGQMPKPVLCMVLRQREVVARQRACGRKGGSQVREWKLVGPTEVSLMEMDGGNLGPESRVVEIEVSAPDGP